MTVEPKCEVPTMVITNGFESLRRSYDLQSASIAKQQGGEKLADCLFAHLCLQWNLPERTVAEFLALLAKIGTMRNLLITIAFLKVSLKKKHLQCQGPMRN